MQELLSMLRLRQARGSDVSGRQSEIQVPPSPEQNHQQKVYWMRYVVNFGEMKIKRLKIEGQVLNVHIQWTKKERASETFVSVTSDGLRCWRISRMTSTPDSTRTEEWALNLSGFTTASVSDHRENLASPKSAVVTLIPTKCPCKRYNDKSILCTFRR